MADQYRCGLENSNWKDNEWPIDISVVSKTQTQTDKTMTDQYRCGPETQTQIDKTMNE